MATELPRESQLLEFEQHHPEVGAAKNEAIRAQLGISPVRYYQILERLADTANVIESNPVLMHRVRRVRDQRVQDCERRAAPRRTRI